jgi:aryl-alcohol dehydrogenase-like predicted oxidoreductase
MDRLPHRPLGTSGVDVSVLALGSWRTNEHIPRERAVAVMVAAREQGIAFLDDARYDDRTGRAPIPTGWSEVLFGELFRAAGWKRDEVVVSNKLWWEFWPEQSAAEELEASLGRMGFDHLDLVYSWLPPEGLGVAGVVREIGPLIAAGKARGWGVGNWSADDVAEAVQVARGEGLPEPCAEQVPYSLLDRDWVEGREAGTSVVASAVLSSGALSGKYAAHGAGGRLAGQLDDPRYRAALGAAVRLSGLADRLGTAPATLAIAFCLASTRVASVLFGATTPEQVVENSRAVTLLERLTEADLAELRAIGADAAP